MFVEAYQVILVIVTLIGVSWGIIVFVLKRIEKVRDELLEKLETHLSAMQIKIDKMADNLIRVDERTKELARRIDRVEHKANRKEENV